MFNLSQKEIWEYCAKHSSKESDLLLELERETYLKTLAPQMMSGSLQGRMLSMISKLTRPSNILEIGTFTGYGTLCLSEGLRPMGKITTLEVNKELQNISSKYFLKSPFKDQIHSILGNALDIIPELLGPFDLVYIDAGKQNNADYLELVISKMEKNGLILIDNTLWSGKVIQSAKDQKTLGIDLFNKKVLSDSRLEALILPIRDGLSILRLK